MQQDDRNASNDDAPTVKRESKGASTVLILILKIIAILFGIGFLLVIAFFVSCLVM